MYDVMLRDEKEMRSRIQNVKMKGALIGDDHISLYKNTSLNQGIRVLSITKFESQTLFSWPYCPDGTKRWPYFKGLSNRARQIQSAALA